MGVGDSAFLFACPSFLEGAARVLDIGGVLNEYNGSQDAGEADYNALMADLRAIRADRIRAGTRLQAEIAQIDAATR